MKARIALMGGMGYPATETPWGMPALKARFQELGAEVILVSWSDRQTVYNVMNGYDGFRGYLGDSLGAGSAAQYPGDVDGAVHFVGGFQPSSHDARAISGYIEVSRNVVRAHCIYNPIWIETLGLGSAKYKTAPNAHTKLLVTEHHGAHPDDWGYSQDLLFNEVKALLPTGG